MVLSCECVTKTQWHLYMIRCGKGTLYTGITTDVARRFSEHQRGSSRSAKYLRGRGPLTLILEKTLGPKKGVALSIERQIKKSSKVEKEAMLADTSIIDAMLKCAQGNFQ